MSGKIIHLRVIIQSQRVNPHTDGQTRDIHVDYPFPVDQSIVHR